jgi:hypothetical protein
LNQVLFLVLCFFIVMLCCVMLSGVAPFMRTGVVTKSVFLAKYAKKISLKRGEICLKTVSLN